MLIELFSTDLSEFQGIFASHLPTVVFVYGTATMMFVNAAFALAVNLRQEKPGKVRFVHRHI